jgi:hypothetical protein
MTSSAAFTRHAALAGILLPGAVGLYVVARTLIFYTGQDPTAALLVVAMAATLLVGLAELVVRNRRAFALNDELARLPPALDEYQLERLSPELRQLLRARIEHAPFTFANEHITPYLVGLLVMLGLLGTLLGLFETLSGAGHALTASANVDALRSGLSGPMRGLTRSFGCSAAGVSASAVLGLAAALVRRREARSLAALQAYANGALRELSPLRRQAGALSNLANQGDALPKAATALELAAERLGGLAERWELAHRTAAAAQQQALDQAMRSLRADLSRAAVEAGRDLQASLAKHVEQMVKSTGSAVSEHVARTAQAMERDSAARREGDAALRDKLHTELSALRQTLEQGAARQSEVALSELSTLRQTLEQGAARQSQIALSQAATLEAAGLKVSGLADSVGEQLQTRANIVAELGDRAHQAMAVLEQSGTALESALTRHDRAVDALVSQAGEQLARLQETAAALLQQSGSALENALGGHDRAVDALVGQAGEQLARYDRAVDALVGQASEQLARLQETAATGTLAAVERVVALTNSQAERLAHFESQLQRAQEGHTVALSEQLSAHAAQLGKGLEGTGELVREASSLLKASSVELGAVAEAFARSVERQHEAASTWLETLGELEGAVERAGRGAAADALGDQLASTQEVFARQLQFQRELFEQLRSMRTPPSPAVHGDRDVSV